MGRDTRTRKQNGKPELSIQWISQRGKGRGIIGAVVHWVAAGRILGYSKTRLVYTRVGKSDRQEVVSLALDWVDPFEEGQLSHSFLKCIGIIRSLFPLDPSCR